MFSSLFFYSILFSHDVSFFLLYVQLYASLIFSSSLLQCSSLILFTVLQLSAPFFSFLSFSNALQFPVLLVFPVIYSFLSSSSQFILYLITKLLGSYSRLPSGHRSPSWLLGSHSRPTQVQMSHLGWQLGYCPTLLSHHHNASQSALWVRCSSLPQPQ